MKATWNVFRAAVTGCMAASLLAACSDGRGMGGFKSWRSTPEQRAEWLAKNGGGEDPTTENTNTVDDRKDGTVDPGTLQEGPGTENKGTDNNTPGNDNTATPPATDNAQPPPPAQDLLQEFPSEEAKTQILTELDTAPSEDPAQQKVVNQQDLIVANDAALNGGEDATAKSLIQGITIWVEGEANARTLSMKAVVLIGADVRTLHVEQAPLNKVTGAGQTLNLPLVLKSIDPVQEVAAGDKVYVLGTCKDTACNSIQTRIEFTLDNGNKTAAVFLIQLTAEGYAITHSNIGEPKAFDAAFAEVGGKADQATEQPAPDATNKPAGTDTTATETQDKPAVQEDAAAKEARLRAERDQAIRNGVLSQWLAAHPEAANLDKPAADVAGVGDIVNGTNDSVTVPPKDAPGVGVVDTTAAATAQTEQDLAIRNGVLPEWQQAKALAEQRQLAIRNGALAEWEAAQKAKASGVPVKPADPVQPPVTDAAAAARARYEAQKKAGAYPGAGAKVQPKVTTQSAAPAAATATQSERDLAIRNGVLAQWEAQQRLKQERDLAIRNGVLAQWEAAQKAKAARARYEAQKKAGAYPRH